MKLRSILLAATAAAALSTTAVQASEEPGWYVVGKGLAIMGDDKTEEETHAKLEGDNGYGVGVDVGYSIGNGFAFEFDYSYSSNTVTVKEDGHEDEHVNVDYSTYALDVVYTAEVSEGIGAFGKVGYEWEVESPDGEENAHDNDFVFGLGMEFEVQHNMAMIVEYEHSLIEGPRGDGIFVGLLYRF